MDTPDVVAFAQSQRWSIGMKYTALWSDLTTYDLILASNSLQFTWNPPLIFDGLAGLHTPTILLHDLSVWNVKQDYLHWTSRTWTERLHPRWWFSQWTPQPIWWLSRWTWQALIEKAHYTIALEYESGNIRRLHGSKMRGVSWLLEKRGR